MRLEDGAELAELELRGEVLAGRRARGVRLRDCSLHGCDLAGLRATEASLVRTTLADCRLTGADLAGAALQDVEVRDCRGDLLGLRQARTRRVTFSGCVLVDAELDGARLDQVVFDGCDLTGASFAGASCRAVELRGCTLDGLRGVDGLRGAALEWDALLALVPALAAALGLRVLDAEDQRRPAPRPLHGAPPSGEMCRDAAPRRPRRLARVADLATTIQARQRFFGREHVDPRTGAVTRDKVILSWFGVSNFAAAIRGQVVLLDAWVPRGLHSGYVPTSPQELARSRPTSSCSATRTSTTRRTPCRSPRRRVRRSPACASTARRWPSAPRRRARRAASPSWSRARTWARSTCCAAWRCAPCATCTPARGSPMPRTAARARAADAQPGAGHAPADAAGHGRHGRPRARRRGRVGALPLRGRGLDARLARHERAAESTSSPTACATRGCTSRRCSPGASPHYHDDWAPGITAPASTYRAPLEAEMTRLPASERPEVTFLEDPRDYVRPVVFDVPLEPERLVRRCIGRGVLRAGLTGDLADVASLAVRAGSRVVGRRTSAPWTVRVPRRLVARHRRLTAELVRADGSTARLARRLPSCGVRR